MKADKGHTEVKADDVDDNLITYVFNSAKFFAVNFIKMYAISACGMLFLMFMTYPSVRFVEPSHLFVSLLTAPLVFPPACTIWLFDIGLFLMDNGVMQKDLGEGICVCVTFAYMIYCIVLLVLDTRGGVKCGKNVLLAFSALLVVRYMSKYNYQFRYNMHVYYNVREFLT